MLVLSLPTLFMIDGRASILSARLGLDSTKEPPFFAFVAWGDNSIEMGMGADFKMPTSNGWILKLYAEVQAGFFQFTLCLVCQFRNQTKPYNSQSINTGNSPVLPDAFSPRYRSRGTGTL